MTFDARTSGGTDDRGVHGRRREDHAISGLQLEPPALVLENESDGTVDAVQDLFLVVAVRRIAVAWTVRPRVAAGCLVAQPGHQVVQTRHRPILRLLQ